jgi:hypothetical protein
MGDQFSDLIEITFIADANTPSQYVPFNGKTVLLPMAVQIGATTTLIGIPGVFEQQPGGIAFLMTAAGQQVDATAPLWAQQLRADLVTAFSAAHDDRVVLYNLEAAVQSLVTQVGQLEQTIAANLTTVATNVVAIKTKVGA